MNFSIANFIPVCAYRCAHSLFILQEKQDQPEYPDNNCTEAYYSEAGQLDCVYVWWFMHMCLFETFWVDPSNLQNCHTSCKNPLQKN